LVADTLRRLGRPEEALAVLDEALARTPREARLLCDKGVLEALLGRVSQARTSLEKAVAADPDRPEPYLSLGGVLASTGDVAGARRVYATGLARPAIRGDAAWRRRLEEALNDARRRKL
jgi:Flp pilus assembly protein TadD